MIAKFIFLLATLIQGLHGFQFIENWLCPKVNTTLQPRISGYLEGTAQQLLSIPEEAFDFSDIDDSLSTCSSFTSYSALGDSYAAGLGSKKRLGECASPSDPPSSQTCTPVGCSKNTGSYGYLFAQTYQTKNFAYLPCSGANSSTVLTNQIDSKYFLTPDNKAPELVSITVGGDDLDLFVDLVLTCVLTLAPNGTTCPDWIKTSKAKIPTIASNLSILFKRLQSRIGPSTKVVVTGYPLPFGTVESSSDPNSFCPFDPQTAAERSGINAIVAGLNHALAKLAKTHGFLFADVDSLWTGHRWCDNGASWFDWSLCDREVDTAGKEFFNIAFAHPTSDGQRAYLQAMKNALKC